MSMFLYISKAEMMSKIKTKILQSVRLL